MISKSMGKQYGSGGSTPSIAPSLDFQVLPCRFLLLFLNSFPDETLQSFVRVQIIMVLIIETFWRRMMKQIELPLAKIHKSLHVWPESFYVVPTSFVSIRHRLVVCYKKWFKSRSSPRPIPEESSVCRSRPRSGISMYVGVCVSNWISPSSSPKVDEKLEAGTLVTWKTWTVQLSWPWNSDCSCLSL